MKAMVLDAPREPLRLDQRDIPQPGPGQLLVKVRACGVCRTDLHVVDGDLKHPMLPLVPGHEVVGVVQNLGGGVTRFSVGQRVGIPWLGRACGHCPYCLQGRENLCDTPLFTGYQIDGGYAEYAVADADYCFAIPDGYDDIHAAPLLCAGLIGYRAYKATGDRQILGLYGFGAAAHIVAQLAQADGRRVLALTRPGDIATQKFARELGAEWAGSSYDAPPVLLDAAIIFAPDGGLVPAALKAIRKGGRVVCAGIHMSDIPSFPYEILWQERELVSIANLTRKDGHEFMARAGRQHIDIRATPYPLVEANAALDDLREGRFDGAAVLVP
jgi:propanol-preferring alcohol dehydrogenase